MPTAVIAICSNPDCSRHAAAPETSELPQSCPTCGALMLDRCWKCERPLTDPFTAYCTHCGVPLKRILPRPEPRTPWLAICSNPECDGAVETMLIAAHLALLEVRLPDRRPPTTLLPSVRGPPEAAPTRRLELEVDQRRHADAVDAVKIAR
jgi:predicted RNA-binding Zn-ribbon protein involved in translation (DUF1610 family)